MPSIYNHRKVKVLLRHSLLLAVLCAAVLPVHCSDGVVGQQARGVWICGGRHGCGEESRELRQWQWAHQQEDCHCRLRPALLTRLMHQQQQLLLLHLLHERTLNAKQH